MDRTTIEQHTKELDQLYGKQIADLGYSLKVRAGKHTIEARIDGEDTVPKKDREKIDTLLGVRFGYRGTPVRAYYIAGVIAQ